MTPREVMILQSQYHVEALKAGTMGPAVRKEGEKFPAVELSRVQFLLLEGAEGQRNEYMALHKGPVPTAEAVEVQNPTVSFREDGTERKLSDVLRKIENSGEYEGEVKPLAHSVVEEAELKATEEGKTEGFVEPRRESRLPSREKASEFAALNIEAANESEKKEAETAASRRTRKAE